MIDYYLQSGSTEGSIDGLRTIAIHVLGTAGYGISQPWKEEEQKLEPGRKISYIGGLHEVANKLVLAALFPARVLLFPGVPAALKNLGHALVELPLYTKEMLARERNLAAESPEPRNNLMSILIKASDEEKLRDSKVAQRNSLTEDEIQGNLFVFTLAGFDTSANTLGYAITALAANPEWQDWLIEEIDRVAKEVEDQKYENVFPKLVRCLAFMVSCPK